jgi:anti-sigma regulatory factor (Ser/Thr protein kinase)
MDAPSATTLALPSTPEAGALARQAVRALCSEAHLAEEACDVALLLVTELVSNAVQHAGAAPVLDVQIFGDAIRIAVRDPSPTLPEPAGAPDDLVERGRGLLLVDSLAQNWGAEPGSVGKTVWCEVELAREASVA